MSELALTFDCEGSSLIGILHKPDKPLRRGVVIVVGGGPQYRAGGHRQLTSWSRKLCDSGHAVLRFDYRGMGDSQGKFEGFLGVDVDIRSAIDVLVREAPELDEVVLWGERDAASAILLYAGRDHRVKGAVLNPLGPHRVAAGPDGTALLLSRAAAAAQPVEKGIQRAIQSADVSQVCLWIGATSWQRVDTWRRRRRARRIGQ